MRALRQWVCWRAEERNGKPTKVPYSPTTGSRARSNDPATWATLAQVRSAAQKDRYGGIGFVFTESDPFCGVDLDSCVRPETGEVEPWAMSIVGELDSYTEISPSGRGLHVLVRADLTARGNRKDRIEMYDRERFFTVTGNYLHGTPTSVEERQQQIQTLHSRLFPPRTPETPSTNGSSHEGTLDDAEILRRAMSASNGSRFAALWAGDTSGYSSYSEAGLALCSMLAFWEGNYVGKDANDLLAMLWTWQNADIGTTPGFGGDLEKALGAIEAKAIVMPGQTDLYFPPEDNAYEVSHMPNAELRPIPSIWGHFAGSGRNPEDVRFIDEALRELLAS